MKKSLFVSVIGLVAIVPIMAYSAKESIDVHRSAIPATQR